eukprot:3106724-Rhodomonas_salina.1
MRWWFCPVGSVRFKFGAAILPRRPVIHTAAPAASSRSCVTAIVTVRTFSWLGYGLLCPTCLTENHLQTKDVSVPRSTKPSCMTMFSMQCTHVNPKPVGTGIVGNASTLPPVWEIPKVVMVGNDSMADLGPFSN